MFNLNANTDEFKARSKSVFDTLTSLESTHNAKAKEYIDKSLDHKEPNLEEPVPTTSEFKVPSVPALRQPASLSSNKRRYKEPDYVANPHKWKRYSLEDVKESDISAAGNYRAAMSFIHRNEDKSIEKVDLDKIEFNRPIGRNRNRVNRVVDVDEEVREEGDEEAARPRVEPSEFRKKNRRANMRRKEKEDEDQIEKSVDVSLEVDTKAKKEEAGEDDEFKDFRSGEADEEDEPDLETPY